MNFKFPQFSATPLASIIPSASKEAIALMEDMLRCVLTACLHHPKKNKNPFSFTSTYSSNPKNY